MGKIVRQGVEYGGSSNSADCIKYNDTKSVKIDYTVNLHKNI